VDLEGWIVLPGATPHALDSATLFFALRSIEDHGFVVLPGFFSREHLETFAPQLISHTQHVLADLRQSGATIGSHRLTNHLRPHGSKPITSEIVYQNARNCPELIGSDEAPFCIAMPRGSVLIFDDRILHRGLANGTLESRYVGYLSFRRRSFETTAYFEATRSLYRP